MRMVKTFPLIVGLLISHSALSGPNYASGKITSLAGDETNPAIRLTNNVSPDQCDGGTYGWLYFAGTAEERARTYATALAMALTGHRVTVYTNSDGTTCRITNIQALGLN